MTNFAKVVTALLIVCATSSVYLSTILYEKDQESDRLKNRLNNVSSELAYATESIENNFDFEFVPKCSEDQSYLNENDLGLKIDKLNKTIRIETIFQSAGLSNDSSLIRLIFDPNYFGIDGYFWKKFKISKSGDSITVKPTQLHDKESAHTLQLIALIEDSNRRVCRQNIRLFMTPEIQLPEDWYISSVIGRAGMSAGDFSLPYGTEYYDGRLWTTDCSNENISVFNLDGHFQDSFSKFGDGVGELNTPADMKIFNDKIFVVEELNNRVQIFSLKGEPISTFGSFAEVDDYEKSLDKFNNPLGISVIDDLIAVVDYANNRVLAFDHQFKPIWVSGNRENDTFDWRGAYYIDYSHLHDHFVVSNGSNSEIGVIDTFGKKVKTFGNDVLGTPFELAVTKAGDVIVSDTTKFQMVWFDGTNDYNVKHIFPFPEFLGIPKTVTSISNKAFAVGFVGNGTAYFLLIEKEKLDGKHNVKKTRPRFNFSKTNPDGFSLEKGTEISQLYLKHCASCHENGKYGAPARGNMEAWEGMPRDVNELLFHVVRGKGAMIANGGCTTCTDDQLSELIRFMLPVSWERY